ncbi:MAG: (2Fe-2S) ferredoxin domain-containing protein [Anaerovoracaceae bacterium]
MKTLEELEKISAAEEEAEHKKGMKRISVGMATCGIAAGARPVMNALANEIRTRGTKNVELSMMGCIGMCKLEPIMEVCDEDGTKTIYIQLTPEKAVEIYKKHIVDGCICTEFTAK